MVKQIFTSMSTLYGKTNFYLDVYFIWWNKFYQAVYFIW